ncbi:MAG: thiopurine S-methyltransferase [Woeseiaceae bacterium]
MSNDWLERWEVGRIGWHETDGNKSLPKYWQARGRRVLVPLCGKSKDLLWLERQGNDVVGVELSDIAARAFFDENGITYSVVDGRLPAYVGQDYRITIYCGDYFDLSLDTAEAPFDALYDRGALVAIQPNSRISYVKHTRSLLTEDAFKLIISVEYDQSIASGPPFSVPTEAQQALWPELERIDAYDDMDNCPPKFREAGLKDMLEVVWMSQPSTPRRRTTEGRPE